MHGEVSDVLAALPAQSVARVFLLFSDPWPKRRHAVRRLVQPEFVTLLATRLAADGSFFFASDSSEYVDLAEDIFRSGGWQVSPWQLPPDWPPTEFEQRFVSAGVQIRRFQANR
jgi:tRNA (guanine-N7-)-methyltransferase